MEQQAHKLLVIGLGRIGRKLVKRLSRDYVITCIESNSAVIDSGDAPSGKNINIISGDATSRLTLEEAGAADADTVLITTTSEKINLEIARIMHEFFPGKRMISIGITQNGITTLEDYGAEVESLFDASVIGLLNLVEQKSRSVHGIGLGKNEIREVEVHPHSKLANKQLFSLASLKWRIGIIYRDGNIVVPDGSTALRPRDKVVIHGEPGVLNTVADLLACRFKNFPLEYGSRVLACIAGCEQERFFEELSYLLGVFKMTGVTVAFGVRADRSCRERIAGYNLPDLKIIETPAEKLSGTDFPDRSDIGFVILDTQSCSRLFSSFMPGNAQKDFILGLSQNLTAPVLLSGGTFPYTHAAALCLQNVDVTHVMENVFEMSSLLQNKITALFVKPSEYIASADELDEFHNKQKSIRDLSNVYKLSVSIETLSGNPVRSALEHLHRFNLILVDTSGWKRQGFFGSLLNPDTVWKVVSRSPVSTLLIPEAEESF